MSDWGDYANKKLYYSDAPSDDIVEKVINKLSSRSEVGVRKYSTTLKKNNRDNYLKHLQEELMDAVLYIEKEMDIYSSIDEIVNDSINDEDIGRKVRDWLK